MHAYFNPSGDSFPQGVMGSRFLFGKTKPMDQIKIPVGSIKTGFNYRRRYNQAAMDTLVEDIKQKNLLTPVLVRQQPDGAYQLIAGNRRVIAFTKAFGEDAEIPALVRVMTDAEATAAMVSENKEREDTSAIEDAEAATRLLGLLNGDKKEAAARLGWSANKLDRRLAIMNATDNVRDAYIEERIDLGHVEILAAMRREVQEQVLSKMLAAPAVPTVEQLKAMAEQVLLSLEAAIFDKADCNGCHFNTGNQQALFETSFDGVRCTNGECYGKKTEEELEKRRLALTETYQVVRIVRPGDNATLVPLRADGPKGVGDEQALACRTCADFGACVSAAPDKLGQTYKDVCFNSTCNAEKVDIRVKAEKAAELAAAQQSAGSSPQTDGSDQAGQETGEQTGGTGKPEKVEPFPKKPPSSVPRNTMKEYRKKIWRAVFQRAAVKLPIEKSRALLIAICLHRPRTMDSAAATEAVAKAVEIEKLSNNNAHKLTSALLALDTQHLGAALQQLPAYVTSELEINSIVGFLKTLDIKLEHHWKVNETFFDLLTKTEIDAVCCEIGIEKAIGKDYSKLKNGSKADFVKAALSVEGFEYKGKVPKLMLW